MFWSFKTQGLIFATWKVGNWIIIGRKINRKIIGPRIDEKNPAFSVALFIYTKIRSTRESPIFLIVQIFVKRETSVQTARSSRRIEFCNEDVSLNDIRSYNRKTHINSNLLLKWNVSTGVFEECVSQRDSTKLRYRKKQGNRIGKDLSYRRQKKQMFSYDRILWSFYDRVEFLAGNKVAPMLQRWRAIFRSMEKWNRKVLRCFLFHNDTIRISWFPTMKINYLAFPSVKIYYIFIKV